MKDPERWRGVTRVYTSSADDGYEAEFARGAVRRVLLQLRPNPDAGPVSVEVGGSERVWGLMREGLPAGVDVRRNPTMGADTAVSRVSVGGRTVGESVLRVSRVGLVWLVDAHWTVERYAEWATTDAQGAPHAWTVRIDEFSAVLVELLAIPPVPASSLGDLETLKSRCGGIKLTLEVMGGEAATGVASDEGRRGVLVRGIMRAIGEVDGRVGAIDEAIAELSTDGHHGGGGEYGGGGYGGGGDPPGF